MLKQLHGMIKTGPLMNWSPVLCLIAFGIAVTLPAIIYGIPYGPDIPAHFRYALSFDEAVRHGNLYPGWLAASNGGYGDPSFRFYPPGLYYLLILAHGLIGDWYAATLFTFTLLSVAGGLCVYFWASAVCPRRLAIWAGIFYMVTAYHINELYQSSLIAEYAGGALFALVLGFTERLYRRGRTLDLAGLSVSFAILGLTHLPLTMMASLVLVIYALMKVREKNFRPFALKLGLGMTLGLAASACYWTTLLTELSWIRGDVVAPGTRYAYSRNFLFWTSSPESINNWWGNIIAVAMLLMLWPAFAASSRTAHVETRNRSLKTIKLLTVFSFLMTTPLSWPLWIAIPKLGSIEFPWRWLAVTSVAGSVALASSLPYWKERLGQQRRVLALLAIGSVLVALVFTFMHPVRAAVFYARPQFNDMLRELPGSASVPEWFPAGSTEPLRAMSTQVEAGPRDVRVASWEDEHRVFEVGAGPEATEARVRTLFYPLWVATSGGQKLSTRRAQDGALLISLPAGAVSVDLQFREPLRAQAAAVLSAVAWLLMGALFVAGLKKKSGYRFALNNAEANVT